MEQVDPTRDRIVEQQVVVLLKAIIKGTTVKTDVDHQAVRRCVTPVTHYGVLRKTNNDNSHVSPPIFLRLIRYVRELRKT
jgi:hypothetical protein